MVKVSVQALALVVLFGASFAQAAEDGFDAVYRNCFAKPVSRFQYISIEAPGPYQTALYDVVGEVAKIFPLGAGVVENVGDAGRAFFAADYRGDNWRTHMELMSRYIQTRTNRLPDDENKDFSKSCMVLCASANYLNYKKLMSTKFGGLSALMDKKQGECTEFAHFADHLAGRVGISSRVSMNMKMGHAYVKFYVPSKKKWYYAEPQSSQCRFMDPSL